MNNQQFLTLVAGHRAGCKKSQDQLFEYMYSEAERVFSKKNYSNQYTFDDMSEVMIDKIEFLMKFNYDENASSLGLVWRSLNNVVLDYNRKHSKNPTINFTKLKSVQNNEEVENDYLTDLVDKINSNEYADSELYKKEKINILKKGIATLSNNQREVMWLLLIERLTQEEVITVLKITNQQLYNLKCQGKIKLEKFIKKHGYRM
jgi:RNA polymerase sigma factor (sigma-70 family)